MLTGKEHVHVVPIRHPARFNGAPSLLTGKGHHVPTGPAYERRLQWGPVVVDGERCGHLTYAQPACPKLQWGPVVVDGESPAVTA